MSRHWPGWRTLPGIEIAPLAEKARERGEPWRQLSYVWGPDEQYVTGVVWQAGADGTVSIPWDPGWEPLVEDGMLTGFRGTPGGITERLVQVAAVVVPEGEPPWSPALTVRLPEEQIGAYRVGDSMADGIDIDTGTPGAGISVGFAGADGSVTVAIWTVTPESAASVIALIRERHGEPATEIIADRDNAGTLQDALLATLEAHAVTVRSRDTEGDAG